jgi:caffeoyl-CoA O-methyltransferase
MSALARRLLCSVTSMISLIAPDLAAFVDAHSSPEPELLTELRHRTQAELVDPQMQVGRVEGALLKLLVAISGARRVVEVGTFSGYSTLSLAAGLPGDGTVVTCDIDPVATAVAREFFAKSPHGSKIDLRLGPALDTLRALASEGRRFDLAFIDADKIHYVDYYEACLAMMGPGGLVVADNALWSGRVLSPTTDDDRAIARFDAHVHADPRVDHVLLSVRDGIMLARKR